MRAMRIKLLVLAIVTAASFMIGFAGAAFAGVIFGRQYDAWWDGYGYFLNQFGSCPATPRDDVMPGGISPNINDPTTFIDAILSPLNGPDAQKRTGAAFIIQTMRGETVNRNKPPTNAQITDWENRVYYAASQGRIKYGQTFTFRLNSCYQGNSGSRPDDDMFWDTVNSGMGIEVALGIRFLDANGNPVYDIQYKCANPVGQIGGIPPAPSYTVTGRTTVSSPTVLPGQRVTFSHYLKNSGPDAASVSWSTKDGNTNATITNGSNAVAANTEVNVNNETFTVPNNAAFGTKYCRYISFSPQANGTGSGNGATVCTTVVSRFNITPVAVPSSSTAQQGDTITFTYSIINAGPTRTQTLSCTVAGQNEPSGYTPLPQQDVNRTPAVVPQPSPMNCNQEFPTGNTTVAVESVPVGTAAVGSHICRSLVINPKDQNGGYRSSAEVCVTIAKSPYVQFMGNDVWAGGNFAAVNAACNNSSKIQTVAHTLRDGSVAGSAVEYGAFALGKITNFGSANKALVDPAGPAGKALTFSNLIDTNLGNYGAPQHCINDYVSLYTKTAKDSAAAAIDVGTQASGTQLDVTGPHSFSGTMAAGSKQIYLVEGDVTITGDLKYPANYSGPDQIPSLIIIATGNITVNRGVQQMDGLFVARGQFFTCDVAVGSTLTVNPPCEKQLVINGAVKAGKLQLLRTFGADGADDTSRKRAAEIFNFSPEMYLNSALYGNNTNVLQTVDEKDLPPRF